MRIRSLALFTFVVLSVPVQPVRAAEAKADAPTVVVRLNSIDGLISDLLYLADAAGKGNEAKQVAGILKNLDGVKGLDMTKPIGLYGRLATKLEESDFALMVPISNEKEFLTLLEGVGVKFEKGQDDVYKVDLPKVPFAGYFRFANSYVYGTIRDPKLLAKGRLIAPAAVLEGRAGALEVALNLEQVPAGFKELIVSQAALRLSEAKGEKKPSETEAQHKLRIALADEAANQIKAIVNEGKELTLKLDVDRKTADVVASLRFTAKPGTKLAASIAELGQGSSIVANLTGPGSALGGRVIAMVPQGLRKPYDAFLDDLMKLAHDNAPDKGALDLMNQVFTAVGPTLKAAELDSGFDLRGPAANGKFTLIAATAVKEGADIEKVLRTVHAVVPAEVRGLITLDAEKLGTTNIHRIAPPAEVIDANFKRVFGDGPTYIAIRKDALVIAAGDKALDALKEVLARDPKSGKLVQVEVSVARVLTLDNKNEAAAAIAAKVFAKHPDADKVRLTLEGGKALELRLSAKAKLLELVVLVEEAKQGEQ